jgi:hypothetical protein
MSVTDRDANIYSARVFLHESRSRSHMGQRSFSFVLLEWAAKCRRRITAAPRPAQADLFGGVTS